jgi:hypothetical protein
MPSVTRIRVMPRLAAVLTGKVSPADQVERTRLASRTYEKSLHAASTRLYAAAIANDPGLAADRRDQPLDSAARAAASAGVGVGADDPGPDETAKARLRVQARSWLRSELSARRTLAMTGAWEDRQLVVRTLERGKEDLDLAGVRALPDSPGSLNPSVRSGRTSGPEWTPCAPVSRRGEGLPHVRWRARAVAPRKVIEGLTPRGSPFGQRGVGSRQGERSVTRCRPLRGNDRGRSRRLPDLRSQTCPMLIWGVVR